LDEELLFASFEINNRAELAEFIQKVSADPYVRYVNPDGYWVRYVPTSEQIEISVSTNGGGVTYAKVRITFPNSGYQVGYCSVG